MGVGLRAKPTLQLTEGAHIVSLGMDKVAHLGELRVLYRFLGRFQFWLGREKL
jgi:hypothetical protein